MPRPPTRLGTAFEHLEERWLPSIFGVPWPDADHLTLSFVPDGTPTPTGPSRLFATMGSAAPPAVWEREILRAFQTWAVTANIDIGLVADGGQPLGTTGAVQGDPRFGDIRISAAPIVSTEVAEASPFSWTGTTFSGDVTFGAGEPYRIGNVPGTYDLFTVGLHEAGHVFGLDHSTAPDSAMHESYGYRTGLGAGDIANLQALYGARSPDAFAGPTGNATTAANLPRDPAVKGRFSACAELTTHGAVDWFKFSPASTTASVTLGAGGLSLLEGGVSVYDATGKLVASGAAADVFHNTVTLQLTGLMVGGNYYVKVQGVTADVFAVGRYRLTVDTLGSPAPSTPAPAPSGQTNHTLATAADLSLLQGSNLDNRFVVARGAITSATEADFFRLRAPVSAAGTAVNLNMLVWATTGTLDPRVRVFDASDKPVAFEVLANGQGLISVVVPNTTAGAYFVQVSAGNSGGTGGYVLGADFNDLPLSPVQEVDNGQLAPAASTTADTLSVAGGLYQFGLYAEALAAGSGGVTLTVTDATGQVVFTLDAGAGGLPVTQAVYLAGGTYTLTYTYRGPPGGQPAAPIRYHLSLLELSDGVGTYPPTSPPPSRPSSGTSTTTPTASPTSCWLGHWYFF